MTKVRITGLAVLTAATFGATVGFDSAQAQPGLARCAKAWVVETGGFNDAKCRVPEAPHEYLKVWARGRSLGESECAKVWVTGSGLFSDSLCMNPLAKGQYIEVFLIKPKFTITSGTSRLVNATASVTCSKAKSEGEITGEAVLGKVAVDFTGCAVKNSGGVCTINSTNTTNGGLILTSLLVGLLGEVAKAEATSLVGWLFQPETGHVIATLAATATPCSTAETAVEGSVAGEATPTNTLETTDKINFTAGTGTGKETISLIQLASGKVKPKLTSFGGLESSEEASYEVAFEEEVEVT